MLLAAAAAQTSYRRQQQVNVPSASASLRVAPQGLVARKTQARARE